MDVWARKQDMNTKRAIHTLAGMNDRLYAIGGNHLKGNFYSRTQISAAGFGGGGFTMYPKVINTVSFVIPSNT